MNDKISREELVRLYNVEIQFFDALVGAGLLESTVENSVSYLRYEELPTFERLANWHYDLDVNLPGLEVITRLLSRIELLQEENRKLAHLKFLKDSGLWEEAEYL